jgi:hypothetical protein
MATPTPSSDAVVSSDNAGTVFAIWKADLLRALGNKTLPKGLVAVFTRGPDPNFTPDPAAADVLVPTVNVQHNIVSLKDFIMLEIPYPVQEAYGTDPDLFIRECQHYEAAQDHVKEVFKSTPVTTQWFRKFNTLNRPG